MSRHACAQSSCSHGSWPDRHPAAAVTAGLFTLVFMGMMLSVHPVAAAVLLGVGAVVWLARAVDRERDRRAAIAARADRDYRALAAAPMKWPALPLAASRPLPRRPADHWSITQPMRSAR